jgi:alpha-N-arabinofuranosidase
LAIIKIDPDRQLGRVDRRIFGGFIEHLGRCIYGGIYEEGSPLSDEHGFRRDVLAAARRLRVPVLRWPGGNFVSGYHWQDGVGPLAQRPRRLDLAWHAEESNRFGTDEFIAYCRLLGAEPYICVNMGTGTMDEAQAWVEYCNGTGDTYWANLRRQHGHTEPYGVKYWGLGNEMYGSWQIGALSAADYARKAREFAKVMKWTDPSIQLVSCGENGWSEWDRAVLEDLAPFVDYHSIHIYTGSNDYYRNVFMPHQAERALHICQALIDSVRYRKAIDHPIFVAYDEWNVWFRERDNGLEERYTLADALAVATYLNIFIRHCQTVRIANLAQLVNVIAPIVTNREGLFLQTIYHPLQLYSEHTQEVALDVWVDADTHDLIEQKEAGSWPHRVADLGPFKLLDVAATRAANGHELMLAVVNRDATHDIATTVQFADTVLTSDIATYEVNGPDPDAINSFANPRAVAVREAHLAATGNRFVYTFPAHSVTVLRARY